MVKPNNTTNQEIYKNRQRYNIDIKEAYYSYVKPKSSNTSKQRLRGIDDYRSKKSLSGMSNSAFAKAIEDNSWSLKVENDFQESRCHAFYRIIGFPVYDGTNFYNPGWDTMTEDAIGNAKNISKIKKREIAKKSIKSDFTDLSDAREAIPINALNRFIANNSINASVVSLSIINKRDFAAPLTNIDAPSKFLTENNLDPLRQSYHVDMDALVGDNRLSLFEFIGYDGSQVDLSTAFSTRRHIIYPFLVDARYSESINSDQQLAVPFVLSQKYLKVSDTVPTVGKPMLQSIIEQRASDYAISDGEKTIIQGYVNNISAISDEEFVKNILSGNKLMEQEQFIEYIYMMQSMIEKLIMAKKIIDDTRKWYYWIPIPSTSGPEGGMSIRSPKLSVALYEKSTLITQRDHEIIISSIKYDNTQTSQNTVASQPVENTDIFPFAATIFNNNSDACGNNARVDIKKLSSERESKMKKAGDALQDIELIMGEFSGLGLCDILAIVASLYIMPKENLYGFLDDDAFARMKFKLNLSDATRTTLDQSLTELTNTVRNFYNLMDKMYLDMSQNGSST